MTSFVYFIRESRDGLIKIGWAKNPEARLKELQCGSAADLELLNTYPGGQDLERAYHAVFGPMRVRGEWFLPNPALMILAGRPDLGRYSDAYVGPWGWVRQLNDQLLYDALGLPEGDLFESS